MRLFVLAFMFLAAACGPDLKRCPGCDPPGGVTTPPPVRPPYTSYTPPDLAEPPRPCDLSTPPSPDLASPPDLAQPPADMAQPPCDLAEPPCDRPSCDQTHCGHQGHHCNHGSSCPFHKDL